MGFVLECFPIEKTQGSLIVQASPICSFGESLCGLLVVDPSSLYLSIVDIQGVDIKSQLGTCWISVVYKVNHFFQKVVAKLYKKEYGFALEHEAEILKRLKGLQGIPTIVGKILLRKFY